MNTKKLITSLFLILSLALVLRLIGIQSRPIWYDEAFSLLFAEQSPSEILNNTLFENSDLSAAEEHPPLYYFGLWTWFQFFGASIVSARLFSVFLSLLTILLIYQIAKDLFDSSTALVAAGLVGLLPFQIHFAQEIRMYSMLTFWLALTTLAFLRARSKSKLWWGVFAVSTALAQYTHNLASIYLVTLAFTPLFQRDWKTLRDLTLSGLAALILYLPWIVQLPAQFAKVNSSFWVEQPGIERFFTLTLYYLPHLPLQGTQLMIGFFLAMMILTLGGFQTYLAWRNKISSTRRAVWAAYLAFMSPLLLWLISQIVPVYIERALLPTHTMFCIWLAWAFVQTKAPRFIQGVAGVFIAAVAVMGIVQHVTYNGFPYGSYSKISENIRSQMQAGDIVVHSSKLSYLPAFAMDRDLQQGFIVDPPNSNVDTLSPAIREAFQLIEYENIEEASAQATRVWFVIFDQSIEEYTTNDYKTHPHLEYLDKNLTLQDTRQWNDILVFLYTHP